ncbi:G-PROTEIN-RECEP-F1-2 domain-containing protein [Aphelenchoides besseyi]|nr:G-PROTEIN-RECEP-F1-2 domain-containing protein [Aphelenchoides besseyi]
MKSSASLRLSRQGMRIEKKRSIKSRPKIIEKIEEMIIAMKMSRIVTAIKKLLDLNTRSSIALLYALFTVILSTATATTVSPVSTENDMKTNSVMAIESSVIASNSNHVQHTQDHVTLWAMISRTLWWTVLVVSVCSFPILLHSLYCMLTKFKRSNYFDFMTAMLILNICMISSIVVNLLSDYIPFARGSAMCKLTAFITNTTTCYVNWLWVMMFTQRFAHIFFSVHRPKSGGLTFLEDSRRLLILTGIMALSTQVWAPILMKELRVPNTNGSIEAMYCGPDPSLINPELFKWIAVVESVWTYLIPLVITVLTDIAVLAFTRESKWFTTVSSQSIKNSDVQMPLSLKIQSEEGLRASHKRRRHAVRRCLVLATTQLMLNVPNYLLQLIDEFGDLQSNKIYISFYLWCDAIFYVIYLLQFPAIAVFVRLLHSNYEDRARRRSGYRRQRQLGEDSHSMTESTRKRCSTDFEAINRRSLRSLSAK